MNMMAEGHIVSVNVGAVREIVYRGRPRTTAIWKEPVAGRLPVLAEQVTGDHQADPRVHGGPAKAVYSYASEDYAWWSDELGEKLGPGTFGENLTTAGIDLSDLRIGEQVRAGTALLEVTAPRFPCWKLGFRMGTQKFPRRFLEAARAGTYFAVVEGEDEARRVRGGSARRAAAAGGEGARGGAAASVQARGAGRGVEARRRGGDRSRVRRWLSASGHGPTCRESVVHADRALLGS